jgi:hypothetical protein
MPAGVRFSVKQNSCLSGLNIGTNPFTASVFSR